MRPNPLRTTATHGRIRHRPRKAAVSARANAVVITTCPDTKLNPCSSTAPLVTTSPTLVPGRSRSTTDFTTRSRTSLAPAPSAAAKASRHQDSHGEHDHDGDDDVAELLEHPQRPVEPSGQLVDGPEHRLLCGAHLAVAGD